MQLFKVVLTFTILTLTLTHKCLVYCDGSNSDTISPSDRYTNSHLATADTGPPANIQKAPNIPSQGGGGSHLQQHQQQQQQQHHQQQQQQHQSPQQQQQQQQQQHQQHQQHQQPHQHAIPPQQQPQLQQHQHHQYSSHGIGGVGSSGLVHHHPSQGAVISSQQQHAQGQYHPPSHSSGHVEHKNTYNLLSEAMSQAVSNEFSSLGSGSADGACPADDLECYNVQDRLGMEAIRTLHQQLDDDDNGNIDLSESDDFLREELKYDSGYEKRQKAFHFNDDMHISVKELWEAWLRSEVHNWTIEQTTDWLAQSVQLPQYVDLFKQHKVSGAALPRLAVNNMHYVSNVLGIKDPIHKQKIALKAMDVVLFGPPRETGTRWKDYILVTLLLSAIIGCWYAYQQNKNAKRHLRRMAQDMEGLQRAEQSLQEMQKELERARLEQENVATEKMDLERRLKEVPTLTSSSSDLEVQQLKKEIEMLRNELSRAEIELVDNCWAPPPQLQSWLQYTYELESKNHLKKRLSAEKQLQGAREACEKLRKKRSSLVGAFVSTHGKSIDDVDRSIVEARNSLGEVTNELQERLHRWKQIEQCLGMNIVNNNGLPYLESVLYGRNGGGSSVKSSRGRITSSSDELDDESVQGLMDGYSRNSGLSGSTMLNSSSNPNRDRDDSSGSEDNESQSVHFYLGNIPPPTSSSASVGSMTPAITPRTPLQQSPLAEAFNHVNNHVNASAAVGGAAAGAAAHSHASNSVSHAHSDSVSVVSDVNRHSPSVSSERSDRSSVTVPPRTKKLTLNNNSLQSSSATIASSTSLSTATSQACQSVTSVQPPPIPSGTLGRAPLPPPRKSNQSPLLRSQSSDLMAVKDLYTILGRPQQQVNKGAGAAANNGTTGLPTTPTSATNTSAGNKTKKMVKQHSTASQQSTSSTSSSVQSAPEHGGGGTTTKQQSPSRFSTSSLERQILPQHLQQHQLFHPSKAMTNMTFHSLDRDFLSSVSTLQSAGSLKSDELFQIGHSSHAMDTSNASDTYHSDTQLNAIDNHAPDGASVKKRKRGLRFGFGSSKKSQSISSSSDTSGGKSKHT